MIAGVADTHAAVWYLSNHPNLSLAARQFIEAAAHAGEMIVLSPISLAEIVYLVEKGRLPAAAYNRLREELADPDSVLQEWPFTASIVATMWNILRDDIPDLPDRIIAATAVHLGVPVLSRDGRIRASQVQTIW